MVKVQRRKGDRLDDMLAAPLVEAEHWIAVALEASRAGERELESMCLTRIAQLSHVCELQAVQP